MVDEEIVDYLTSVLNYLLTKKCVSALVPVVHFRYCFSEYSPPALRPRRATGLAALYSCALGSSL